MKKRFPPLNTETRMGYLFFAIVAIRLFFNGAIPLMDKTEARYSEIARLMAETGEWVVLQIDYGIPFWAKPPLSTWASALSIQLFGEHEFFVRLPYALVCIGMALFIGRYKRTEKHSFFLPGVILLTLPEFFLHAGVVSTDVFLTLSIGIVMLSFWEGIQKNSALYWRYLFFAGMGLGLLAKGPIVGVLTVPPIVMWCVFNKEARLRLLRFPWILGPLLTLGIALPWYILAEMRSPGFVDYFIVGEHFKRYFESGWKGDKYGFPKKQPLGMIWVFLLGAILPYAFSLIRKVSTPSKQVLQNSWLQFLLFWLLWTPLFFTSSKSLIHPYTLPVMLPAALIIVHFWEDIRAKKWTLIGGLGFPLVALLVFLSGQVDVVFKTNSDKYLLAAYTKQEVYALNKKSYSSQFYTQGNIQIITAEALKKRKDTLSILITNKNHSKLDAALKSRLTRLDSTAKKAMYFYDGTP